MTAREIERQIAKSGGNLCARLTKRQDGSLVTLEPRPASPGIANIAISAAIVMSSAAALSQQPAVPARQQTGNPHDQPRNLSGDKFPVTGTVTDIQGAVIVDSVVKLLSNGQLVASSHTDGMGQFTMTAPPGKYQVEATAKGFSTFSAPIAVADDGVTTGHVSLKSAADFTVSVSTPAPALESSTGGEISVSYGPWYKRLEFHLRHPIAFAKHLFRRY